MISKIDKLVRKICPFLSNKSGLVMPITYRIDNMNFLHVYQNLTNIEIYIAQNFYYDEEMGIIIPANHWGMKCLFLSDYDKYVIDVDETKTFKPFVNALMDFGKRFKDFQIQVKKIMIEKDFK